MARQTNTRRTTGKLNRSETVTIRLDPRLNYLCDLAARTQRRTKSSFIEAAIDEKIQSMVIASWRDRDDSQTLGSRSDYLWHVRESERLSSLGFAAPHLMTFEEQQIWAVISEHGYFWRGRFVSDGDEEIWSWECAENVLLRDRVESEWTSIVKVALGDAKSDILPRAQENPKILAPLKKLTAPATTVDLDDEIPF